MASRSDTTRRWDVRRIVLVRGSVPARYGVAYGRLGVLKVKFDGAGVDRVLFPCVGMGERDAPGVTCVDGILRDRGVSDTRTGIVS